MLKRLARSLNLRHLTLGRFGLSGKDVEPAPHIVPAGSHPIHPEAISRGASEVVTGLEGAGFQAYVVGGCVRDLLLGLEPKDFDVATNATPEQIKQVFRRARIIGRRFRIVHVRCGREVVEVTTFRAHHNGKENDQAQRSKAGMLLRDNVFGSIDEDASRRDFTINALYYHPTDNTIYDYADGLHDLEQRCLKMIGDADTRYREDPVRLLRAARFAAKLDFSLDTATAAPIPQTTHLLRDISPARLFDESLKLLMGGYGLAAYQQLRELGLFAQLFPATAPLLAEENHQLLVENALRNTDLRIHNQQRVTPAFIFAALLWPPLCAIRDNAIANGDKPYSALQQAIDEVLNQQVKRTAIPRRFTTAMREIWTLQSRLHKRGGQQAARLVETPRFRAGYDFLLLRETAGEDTGQLGEWWTRYQDADPAQREAMSKNLPSGRSRRRPARRRRTPRRDD